MRVLFDTVTAYCNLRNRKPVKHCSENSKLFDFFSVTYSMKCPRDQGCNETVDTDL